MNPDINEEQVWRVHKFVCGPRSNPFSYPGFSQKELDDWITLSDDPRLLSVLASILQAYGGSDSVKVRFQFDLSSFGRNSQLDQSLQDQLQKLKDPGLDLTLSTRESIVFAGLRAMKQGFQERYEIARGGRALEIRPRLAAKYPFNILAWAIRMSTLPELVHNPAYSSWSTKFRHKYLFCTFLSTCAQIETSLPILEAADYTTNETKRFAGEVVAVTHPHEAKLWLEWMEKTSHPFKGPSAPSYFSVGLERVRGWYTISLCVCM